MTTTPSEIPADSRRARRLDYLLVASAVGVYALIVVGAVTSVFDGAVACSTWPACNGRFVVPPDDPALLVAWLHRAATVLVGLLLVAATATAWRNAEPRVRWPVGAATLLYLLEVAIGAVTVTTGATRSVAAAHLVVAMAIFSAVLVALTWHLDALSAPDADETERTAATSSPTSPGADVEGGDGRDEPAAGASGPDGSVTAVERVRAYIRLTKPRLMWLLCLVALAGMGLASGRNLDAGTAVATLTGGVLAIGASGVFNNVLEVERDREMGRTDDRPLVTGALSKRRAVAFGLALALGAVATFLVFVNALAAALGALAILFYSVGYTVVLKPNTRQNVVIGGAVGAFPALIGWAAVTDTVGVPAVVLGVVIFLWTPAHFYNLALAYRDDYEAGGFPMMSVVAGEATTRRHIALYLGATLLGAVLLGTATELGWLYGATTTIGGAVFLWAVVGLFRDRTTDAAFRSFHASNAYLGALLLAVIVDTLLV